MTFTGKYFLMDLTHLHLLITHLPIYGSILGVIVLAFGLLTKSQSTLIAAYLVFIISALGAITAYSTGEAAEETVESIQLISKGNIESHEDFAIYALWSFIILGVISLFGLLYSIKNWTGKKFIGIVLLCIACISFGLVAFTGYLGGQIRHTEVGNTNPTHEIQEVEDNE